MLLLNMSRSGSVHNSALLATVFLIILSSHHPATSQLIFDKPGGDRTFCFHVVTRFLPCTFFLRGTFHAPSGLCCDNVGKINAMRDKHRKAARRTCYCIQGFVNMFHIPLNASRIEQLPTMCDTHLSFPISSSMDCSTVPAV